MIWCQLVRQETRQTPVSSPRGQQPQLGALQDGRKRGTALENRRPLDVSSDFGRWIKEKRDHQGEA